MKRAFSLAALVIGGVVVAGLVVNIPGTRVLVRGVTGLWTTSINGLLGRPAGGGGGDGFGAGASATRAAAASRSKGRSALTRAQRATRTGYGGSGGYL